MVSRLSASALRSRALHVRLVLSDVDGVLTDAGVYYGPNGEEWRRFSVRDGMGFELLRNAGLETGIVTREHSAAISARAQKLGLRHVFTGVRDKLALLPEIIERLGLRESEVAYIGDDVNDLPVLRALAEVGLTAAPADALPEVRAAVHVITEARGGHGAFREFAALILRARSGEPPQTLESHEL